MEVKDLAYSTLAEDCMFSPRLPRPIYPSVVVVCDVLMNTDIFMADSYLSN